MNRPRLALYALLAMLAVYDAQLLRKGAFAWPDEFLYAGAYSAVDSIVSGHPRVAAWRMNRFGARPGAETLWLVPAAIQIAAAAVTHLNPWSRAILHIPTLWNPIVVLLLVLAVHRLSLRFFNGDEWLAAATAATFALLPSTHLWVRHVVPYDIALFLWMVDLYRVVSRPIAPDRPGALRRIAIAVAIVLGAIIVYVVGYYKFGVSGIALAIVLFSATVWMTKYILDGDSASLLVPGLIAGFALTVYPAYYAFPAALLALIALRRRPPLTICALFILAMLDVLFIYEIIARAAWGGGSYLGNAARLSTTVTQGAFEEGYVFLARYLAAVDGAIGVAMFVLAIAFIVLAIARRELSDLRRTVFIFAALCLAYGTQAVVLHKMVFSGRFVRMYLPIVVIAAFGALRVLPLRARQVAMGVLVLLALGTFVVFVRSYSAIEYPVDVLARLGIGFDDVVPDNRIFETTRLPEHDAVMGRMPGTHFQTHPEDRRYILVNFGFFDLEGSFNTYAPPPSARLTFHAEHFLCFPPSGFESYGPARRKQFADAGPCQLKIYRVAD